MNEEIERDYDQCDVPRGTDPLIRVDGGREWFNYNGCWWQAGKWNPQMPADARRAYLDEVARRTRRAS